MLVTEYEEIKCHNHKKFKFVDEWSRERKFNKKIFLKYYRRYKSSGNENDLLPQKRGPKIRNVLSAEQEENYKNAIFSILHSPPKDYGFNRTSWRQKDILIALNSKGLTISKSYLRQLFKKEGYSYKQARKALTSNDPQAIRSLPSFYEAGLSLRLRSVKTNT